MGEADGSVIIEVDLRTKKFEQKIKQLETKLANEKVDLKLNAGEIEKLKYELTLANAEYNTFLKRNKETLDTVERKESLYKKIVDKMQKGVALTSDEYHMYGRLSNDLSGLYAKRAEINKELSKYNKYIEDGNEKLSKAERKQELIKQKIQQTKASIKLVNQQEDLFHMKLSEAQQAKQMKEIAEYTKQVGANALGAKKEIANIGDSINRIVKKVSKWALAVFGVRSAYLAIRQAMSTLSQYDEDLSASLSYIRYALATAIKPIVEWLINAVYTLLQYINYISIAWFNYNLFQKASVKNFKSMNKSAKQLSRTLAGFDEMNILSSNKGASAGGGTPLSDLSNMKDVPIPKWVQWIADHKDLILTVLGALAATFAASTIAKWVSNLGLLTKALGLSSTGVLGLLSSIATFGAIAITIFIIDQWWKDVEKLKSELTELRTQGAKWQEEWINGEKDINSLLKTGNVNRKAGYDLLEQSTTLLAEITGYDKKNVEQAEQTAINIGKQVDKEIELLKEKEKENGATEETRKLTEDIKNNIAEQVKYNEQVKQRLEELNMPTEKINSLNEHLLTQYQEMGGEVNYVKDELGNINNIKLEDKSMVIDIDADTQKAEKKTTNWLSDIADTMLNLGLTSFAGIWGSGAKLVHSLTKSNAKGAIYVPPKLAVGGVINQPGRGIPLGSAIGGERGAEGVIPLTDSQQMELLGEAIGRYISINLTNITELDGRQIARKIDKVRQNDNFVMNR